MDETSTREKQAPDNPGQGSSRAPDNQPSRDPRPGAAEHTSQGNHPDGPDHPTTAYDHIWYDRRPLH